MTNIFKTPEKHGRKKRLFQIGLETLQRQGWAVKKEIGVGKSSVRRITRNGESKLVSIKTTQDQWISFAPESDGGGWNTLDDVDVTLAVSVDASTPPREAWVHWLPADEMRERFDRARAARKQAKRVMPKGRGIWIPLYEREDARENVSYVGGGAGLDHPPIARVPLNGGGSKPSSTMRENLTHDDGEKPLTIAAAKRGLSVALGVPEESIKITVEA